MSDIIAEKPQERRKVQIVGFGAFEVKERPARKARNPKTGEEIQIGARRSPMFKPGKARRKPSKAEKKTPEGSFRVSFLDERGENAHGLHF